MSRADALILLFAITITALVLGGITRPRQP